MRGRLQGLPPERPVLLMHLTASVTVKEEMTPVGAMSAVLGESRKDHPERLKVAHLATWVVVTRDQGRSVAMTGHGEVTAAADGMMVHNQEILAQEISVVGKETVDKMETTGRVGEVVAANKEGMTTSRVADALRGLAGMKMEEEEEDGEVAVVAIVVEIVAGMVVTEVEIVAGTVVTAVEIVAGTAVTEVEIVVEIVEAMVVIVAVTAMATVGATGSVVTVVAIAVHGATMTVAQGLSPEGNPEEDQGKCNVR